jgi:threonylcarbamoyladenosine tRNA methylthiotransferase MtaB
VDAIDCYEIAYPHVFMYSARTGTPAARIPRQVDRAIKKQRADALRARGAAVRARVLHSRLSATSRVLIEDAVSSGGYRRARGGDYIPVYLDNGASVLPEPGQWLTVAHRGIMHDGLLAVPAAGD